MKVIAKCCVHALLLSRALPPALLAGFGRGGLRFEYFAEVLALVPAVIGDYLRVAYYKLALTPCSLDWRIQFGSFFTHPQVTVGRHVYIGSYCVLGLVDISDHTNLATPVQC